jgi:hypothetical protein
METNMLATKLNCPKCAAEIPAENMNLDRMVAKCAVCNSVFSFDKEFTTPAVLSRQAQFDVPQPERVKMENENGVLTIRLSWFSTRVIFMTLFALFWNGIMLSVAGGGLLNFIMNGSAGMLFIFVTPHFWVGLIAIYFVLAGYINETRVTVDNGRLTVRHGPLPYWGNKEMATSDILQLYTKNHYTMWRNNWSGHYQLHAITGKNKHEKLLSGWDNSNYLLFVEQEVEHFLGIDDYPVRGEYGRM